MDIDKHVKYINKLFETRVDEEFFTDNFIGLSRTLSTYQILKKSLHDKGGKHYSDFEANFTQFYKIRFTSDDFKKEFYKMLHELSNDKLDIDAITMSNRLDDGEKIQFSFLTKMFNIIDDDTYPIYDSNVAKTLKIQRPIDSDILKRKEKYLSIYRGIQCIYQSLMASQSNKIETFKKTFDCPNLSDIRILDLIIWKLGEKK